MGLSLLVGVGVFAGPCNPTPISQTELGGHRQGRAAGIGDLSDWQGWHGGSGSPWPQEQPMETLPAMQGLWAGKGSSGKDLLFLRSSKPLEIPKVFSFMKQHKSCCSLKPGENTA